MAGLLPAACCAVVSVVLFWCGAQTTASIRVRGRRPVWGEGGSCVTYLRCCMGSGGRDSMQCGISPQLAPQWAATRRELGRERLASGCVLGWGRGRIPLSTEIPAHTPFSLLRYHVAVLGHTASGERACVLQLLCVCVCQVVPSLPWWGVPNLPP